MKKANSMFRYIFSVSVLTLGIVSASLSTGKAQRTKATSVDLPILSIVDIGISGDLSVTIKEEDIDLDLINNTWSTMYRLANTTNISQGGTLLLPVVTTIEQLTAQMVDIDVLGSVVNDEALVLPPLSSSAFQLDRITEADILNALDTTGKNDYSTQTGVLYRINRKDGVAADSSQLALSLHVLSSDCYVYHMNQSVGIEGSFYDFGMDSNTNYAFIYITGTPDTDYIAKELNSSYYDIDQYELTTRDYLATCVNWYLEDVIKTEISDESVFVSLLEYMIQDYNNSKPISLLQTLYTGFKEPFLMVHQVPFRIAAESEITIKTAYPFDFKQQVTLYPSLTFSSVFVENTSITVNVPKEHSLEISDATIPLNDNTLTPAKQLQEPLTMTITKQLSWLPELNVNAILIGSGVLAGILLFSLIIALTRKRKRAKKRRSS